MTEVQAGLAIKDWPEEDRPRERLIKSGAHTLSDSELLALLIRTGDPSQGKMPSKSPAPYCNMSAVYIDWRTVM